MGKVGGNPRSSEVPPRLNFAVGDRGDISPQAKNSGPLRERFVLAGLVVNSESKKGKWGQENSVVIAVTSISGLPLSRRKKNQHCKLRRNIIASTNTTSEWNFHLGVPCRREGVEWRGGKRNVAI